MQYKAQHIKTIYLSELAHPLFFLLFVSLSFCNTIKEAIS